MKNSKIIKMFLLLMGLSLLIVGCNKSDSTSDSSKEEVTEGQVAGTDETVKDETSKDETAKEDKENKIIKIGCMSITEPIVTFLAEGLEDDGYIIEPVVFDGNHLPATALKEGSIDGVILNHKVWLDTFNKENNSNLVMPEPYMYYFRNAMYSAKYDTLEEIPTGATIAVPGDPANLDRSLRILDELGFIELDEKTGEFYSKVDIKENIKDIEILETEITATTRSMEDVDAIISGANAVRDAGYDHTKFLYEDPTNTDFPLGLIVDKEDENEDWVKAILKEQEDEEFKNKFNERYDSTYVLFN